MTPIKLIQISDFHYGSTEFKKELLLNVIDYINKNNPDLVVCTGDLTHKGKVKQFQEIAELLKAIKVPFFAVPGNHDARNNGLMFFEQYIQRLRSKLILKDKNTILLGLRSAKDDISEGELGDDQLEWMLHTLQKYPYQNRIIALHHHLVAVPYSGRQRNTLIDAGEVLEINRLMKVDLVLMGHKHVPHVWRVGTSVLVYCGTTCSTKLRADEKPCFNEITLDNDNLEVYVVNSDNFEKYLLISRKQGKTEFIRPRKDRLEHILKSPIDDIY